MRLSKFIIEKKINIISECLELEKNTCDGHRFTTVLRHWIIRNTAFDPRDIRLVSSESEISFQPVNVYSCIAKLEISDEIKDIVIFCQSLEYECFRFDAGSPLPINNTKLSEGRYGFIKNWVLSATVAISDNGLPILLAELLKCVDEGVRWSVGSLIPIWCPRITDSEARVSILFILIRDSHPWVLRETLEKIGDNLTVLKGYSPVNFVKECSLQIDNATKMGWEKKEVLPGFLKILSNYPDAVDNISLN